MFRTTRNLELLLPSGEIMKFPDSVFTGEFQDVKLQLIDEEIWQAYKNRLTSH